MAAAEESRMDYYIRAKLLPPLPGQMLLERPRLIERLVSNLSQPLTLVTGNAGSGKTMLVADFVAKLADRYVWYQLDNADTDPAVFLSYLTYGIRQLDPDFGTATLAYLREQGAKISRHPESGVDVLVGEILKKVEYQLILVLDDYHQLGAASPVHSMIDRILARLPELLHLIIISRVPPPLHLAQLRANGALTIIDRGELLFTGEETQALLRQVFDLELTPAQLEACYQRTEGWIAALHLVNQRAQTAPLDLALRAESEREVLDQLAEALFSAETGEVRRFLLQISLCEQIEIEACRRLFPNLDCAALLAGLARRNALIAVVGEGAEFRLHPSFLSFLRRSSRAELGAGQLAAEHTRLADYFLECGNWEQAARHLLLAEDLERAAAVIAERGRDWIASGRVASLVTTIEILPQRLLESCPRALTYRAEVERLRGEDELAEDRLQRAVKLLEAQADREGEAEALHSLAAIAQRRGRTAEAFERLERAAQLAGKDASVPAQCLNRRGLCLAALGQWDEAERAFQQAVALAEAEPKGGFSRVILNNLGLAPLARGDFERALLVWQRLLHEHRHHPPSPLEAATHLNVARCHFFRDELDACELHLERALELCLQFNLIGTRSETLEAFAALQIKRGREAAAAGYLARAARLSEEAPGDATTRELLDGQAAFRPEMLRPQERRQLTAQAAVGQVASPPADLAIKMLGPVEILRDASLPISEDVWSTRRVRAIFCFIASRRYRRASRETIFETFWNEEEPENVSRNFQPMLARMRQALNSNHPLKHDFILYRDGDYLLNSDFAYQIDLEEFDRLASESQAERRAGRLDRCLSCSEKAIQLYRGEFMQGCSDRWVEEQRRYYREQYLRLLAGLLAAAQKAEQWLRSLRLAQQILQDDPFREDIHRSIMLAYARLDNRMAIKEQYETLRSLLRNALDVEPAAETTRLFLQLSA